MMIARNLIVLTVAGLAAFLALGSMVPAQDADEVSPADREFSAGIGESDNPIWPIKHGIDPVAIRILRDMSEYIKDAKTFTFTLEVAEDVLLAHGQMIQYGGVSEVAVQRPGSLHARFRGEERQSNIVIHDGRCILHNLQTNIYAVAEVPAMLDDAIDLIVERYGLSVPAADLVSRDPYASVIGSVDFGYVVGRSTIDGVECHHLAFAQETIDWQVWIQTGPEPLVRKIVITYKDELGWPQYTARIFNWNLSPRISKRYFDYEPPADAMRAEFLPSQDEEIEQ